MGYDFRYAHGCGAARSLGVHHPARHPRPPRDRSRLGVVNLETGEITDGPQ
jgi:hypothetical protein